MIKLCKKFAQEFRVFQLHCRFFNASRNLIVDKKSVSMTSLFQMSFFTELLIALVAVRDYIICRIDSKNFINFSCSGFVDLFLISFIPSKKNEKQKHQLQIERRVSS